MLRFPVLATEPRVRRQRYRPTGDRLLHRLIGQLIASRVRSGLTQEQVAQKLRTTKSAISRLESGRLHGPHLTTIENYALVVGCHVEITLKPLQ